MRKSGRKSRIGDMVDFKFGLEAAAMRLNAMRANVGPSIVERSQLISTTFLMRFVYFALSAGQPVKAKVNSHA